MDDKFSGIRSLALLGLLAGFLAALVPPSLSGEHAPPSHQRVAVIDGDTLEIDGELIQLFGIDAPELGQLCIDFERKWHCGVVAAYALRELIEVSLTPLRCTPRGTAGDGVPAVCELGNRDIARVMIEEGYAVATPEASVLYAEAEQRAHKAGLGVWGSTFVRPGDWRAGAEPSGAAPGTTSGCNVLGVVTRTDERVYYTPLDAAYADLARDPARGGRIFCSDEEARLAGWRHARPLAAAANPG